jgi:hypothetical protein
MESLVDSLGKAIVNSGNQTERLNSVFCLSLLSYSNEVSIQKLLDHADSIRERLSEDEELKGYFESTVMKKISQNTLFSKDDPRVPLVDELKAKLFSNDTDYLLRL